LKTRMRPELIMVGGVLLIAAALVLGLGALGLWVSQHDPYADPPGALLSGTAVLPGASPVGPETPGAWVTAAFAGGEPIPAQPAAGAITPTPAPGSMPLILPPIAPPSEAASPIDVEALLAQMSLEEKLGQMIMTGLPGSTVGPLAYSLVKDYHIGSVVYFAANTPSPEQAHALSQALQQTAAASGQGIPLIIAIDHEGGQVMRFSSGLTHYPPLMALGAIGFRDVALQAGIAAAQDLQAVGINASLGPVVDVNTEPLNPVIGLRAFGSSPDLVGELGAAYLTGLQAQGMIGVIKHFPGHGATLIDSHDSLPVVEITLDELRRMHLAPFVQAIRQKPGMVMIGHVAFPQIEPSGAPATLSPVLVNGLLRDELGYDGVIMTDAMSMGAIANSYPNPQATVLAALAGCDLLAYPRAEAAIEAYHALRQAVQDGQLSEAQVTASARRVLQLKARFGLFTPPAWPDQAQGFAAGRPLAQNIAYHAITLQGAAQLPVLAPASSLLLVTPDALPDGAGGGSSSYLGDLLQAKGLAVEEWVYGAEKGAPSPLQMNAILASVSQERRVVFVAWDARLAQAAGYPQQVELIRALAARPAQVVWVAGSSPYDLALFPPSAPALASYGGLAVQLEALADALLSPGPAFPGGELPITLNK
jgi:beta-N-acetylhexosaminidase